MADRERLRAAEGPLPGPGPFTVYRGVAGRGRQRNVRGFSWTGTLDLARWFAGRAAYVFSRLADPTVFVLTVPVDAVLFYTNDRQEDEYVLDVASLRPRRLEGVAREVLQSVVLERRAAGG